MLPTLLISWLKITFLVSTSLITSGLQYPGNTPPIFEFKREWIIPEDEQIGSRVTTVRARDEEMDPLVFGLAPGTMYDASNFFTINRNSGDVFLKESLRGQAGNHYLYITAFDGTQTAKIEVLVRVTDSSDRNRNSARHPFPIYNVPVHPPRPKNPIFAAATPHNTATSIASDKESPVLPQFTNPQTTGPVASGYPIPVSKFTPDQTSAAAAANSTIKPKPTDEGERRRNGVGDDLYDGSKPSIGSTTNSSPERNNHRLDLITAFLPLAAAVAFGLIVGVVFFVLHRKCNKNGRRNLMKSISQKKIPADKVESTETSISSMSGELDYNGALFQQIRSKRALSNRYESEEFTPSFTLKSEKDKTWEFPRHHLHFDKILGEGCFGQVWKCDALNICNSDGPQTVAVKTLKENANEKEKKDLLSEVEIMKILDPHPNVVTLLGCCTDKEPVFLIMEFVPYGKLQTYLRESRADRSYRSNLHHGNLTSRDLTSFAYQIAKGMEYISSKGIIHRDLAARNILIGNNKTCKIADFGFARDVIANHVYERKSEGRLPIRWMAPESLYDNIFTSKSDVWSFGILMWEIVTLGSTPYPGLAAAEVMSRVRDGFRPEKPEHCKREMYNIMFYCWDKNTKERPSFNELVQMLDNLLISENDYIELDRFPDHNYYNVTANPSEEKL